VTGSLWPQRHSTQLSQFKRMKINNFDWLDEGMLFL